MDFAFKTNEKYGELVITDGNTRMESGLLTPRELVNIAHELIGIAEEMREHAEPSFVERDLKAK